MSMCEIRGNAATVHRCYLRQVVMLNSFGQPRQPFHCSGLCEFRGCSVWLILKEQLKRHEQLEVSQVSIDSI